MKNRVKTKERIKMDLLTRKIEEHKGKRDSFLEKNIEKLKILTEMTVRIKNGESENEVCREYGISKSAYRYMLDKDFFGISRPEAFTEEKAENLLTWQEKVWRELYPVTKYTEYPDELDKSLDHILSDDYHGLYDKEKRYLIMRFRGGMSVSEIAKETGVSNNEVYITLERAKKNLISGERLLILKYGIDTANSLIKLKKEYNRQLREDAVRRCKEEIIFAKNRNDIASLEEAVETANILIKRYKEEKAQTEETKGNSSEGAESAGDDFSKYNLPTMTGNLLKRKGIYNSYDIIEKKLNVLDNLKAIRGCGNNTIESIMELCYKLDIPMRANEKSLQKKLEKFYENKKMMEELEAFRNASGGGNDGNAVCQE